MRIFLILMSLFAALFLVQATIVEPVYAGQVDVLKRLQQVGGAADFKGAREGTEGRMLVLGIINKSLTVVLGFLGMVGFGIVVYAGYLWFTAGGEDKKVEQAKKLLKNGVIGLLIITFAYAITTFVMGKIVETTQPDVSVPVAPTTP